MDDPAATDVLHDDALTRRIIGMAIRVRRHFGPGLLEGVYEACLCHELVRDRLAIVRQAIVPLVYDGVFSRRYYRGAVRPSRDQDGGEDHSFA
jgi:hypothetical protein